MILGEIWGRLTLEKLSFRLRGIAKMNVHRSLYFDDFRIHFGAHFGAKRRSPSPMMLTLGDLGIHFGGSWGSWRHVGFLMVFRGIPESGVLANLRVIYMVWWPFNSLPQISKPADQQPAIFKPESWINRSNGRPKTCNL